MKIDMELKGIDEILDSLNELPKAASVAVMRKAAVKALAPFVAVAQDLAPRKSGNLSDSVEVTTKIKKSQRTRRDAEVTVYAGPAGKQGAHGHLIEFGTSKMPAHPFVRPAWERTKELVVENFNREIWDALLKSIRSIRKRAAKGTLSRKSQREIGR